MEIRILDPGDEETGAGFYQDRANAGRYAVCSAGFGAESSCDAAQFVGVVCGLSSTDSCCYHGCRGHGWVAAVAGYEAHVVVHPDACYSVCSVLESWAEGCFGRSGESGAKRSKVRREIVLEDREGVADGLFVVSDHGAVTRLSNCTYLPFLFRSSRQSIQIHVFTSRTLGTRARITFAGRKAHG